MPNGDSVLSVYCSRMKTYLLVAMMLLSPGLCPAQSRQITLNGTLEMNTGEKFPYKLVFTESGGVIKGYSITYQAPDDTKASIEGLLDRSNHALVFKETEIQYSHDVHTRAYMCLVRAALEETKGVAGKILKGPITGQELDNTACTGGKIVFSNDGEVRKVFQVQENFDTVIAMKKRVMQEQPLQATPQAAMKEPTATDKITANIEKTYDWHTDTVVLDIWDGGSQDGDKVTLQYNGADVLTNYLLVKEKKQLRLPVLSATNVITIVAQNEGREPPNTASLILTDGNTRYSVLAYNPTGKKAVIKIKKVPGGTR